MTPTLKESHRIYATLSSYRLSRRAVKLVPAAEIAGLVSRAADGGLVLKAVQPRGETITMPAVQDEQPLRLPRLKVREWVLLAVICLLGLIWYCDRMLLSRQLNTTASKLRQQENDYRRFVFEYHQLTTALQDEGYRVDLSPAAQGKARVQKMNDAAGGGQ